MAIFLITLNTSGPYLVVDPIDWTAL